MGQKSERVAFETVQGRSTESMLPIKIDVVSWIPDHVRQQILDGAIEFLSEKAKDLVGEQAGEILDKLKSDARFQRQFVEGLQWATERFNREYVQQDEDLVAALMEDENFWSQKSVSQQLLTLIKRPRNWTSESIEEISLQFDDVLPHRVNRDRVNSAVRYYLQCLAEEIWHLPELQPIYQLQLQRITAERAAEMVSELRGMRIDLKNTIIQLIESVSEDPKLFGPTYDESSSSTNSALHNLPQPDYINFVGRKSELHLIRDLLKPENRVWIVVIDGLGGIGKTALALEIAQQYLKREFELPEQERFGAIVWTSAKTKVLTADGISPQYQSTQTLQDIYRAISITLEADGIVMKDLATQHLLIRRLLRGRRTLLIIDNLETLEDEGIMSFLRDLPAPSKCLVTSRQRIDVAYAIRLVGMPQDDAEAYIRDQATQRDVNLTDKQIDLLYKRTSGIPLAISWSIAQIHFGYEVDSVLFKLGNAAGDIAHYCFRSSLEAIRETEAFTILLAIALVPSYLYLDRSKLGRITGLSDSDRDEGLVTLERLSLVNREKDRISVLDLVREFTIAEFAALESNIGEKQVLRLAKIDAIAAAYALEKLKPFISSEMHSELAEQVTEILTDELDKTIQYGDDYYLAMYVNPLEKLATLSAIATLRAIVSGLFHLPWGSSNIEWAEQEAMRALCRLGDIGFVVSFYAQGLPYTGYLEQENVVSSLLQFSDIDTIAKAIDSELQEDYSKPVHESLVDLKQKLMTA